MEYYIIGYVHNYNVHPAADTLNIWTNPAR